MLKLPAREEEFAALSDCPSSKLQLLQWVPEQRLWKGKLTFALSWKPCKQSSPQKQASAITPFAKTPKVRNRISSFRNILRFPNRVLPPFNIEPLILSPLHQGYLHYTKICPIFSILSQFFTIYHYEKHHTRLPNIEDICSESSLFATCWNARLLAWINT